MDISLRYESHINRLLNTDDGLIVAKNSVIADIGNTYFSDTHILIFFSYTSILAWYFGLTYNMLNGNEFLLSQIPGGGKEITG